MRIATRQRVPLALISLPLFLAFAFFIGVDGAQALTYQQQQSFSYGGNYNDFGIAIDNSSDGSVVAVGSPRETVGASANRGAVAVYTKSLSEWSFAQSLVRDNGSSQERLGDSVAVSPDGNTIVAGVPEYNSPIRTDEGAVVIFKRSGSTWSQQQLLVDPTPGSSDYFGSKVDIASDGTLVVVSSGTDYGGKSNVGEVNIFTVGTGGWEHSQNIRMSQPAAEEKILPSFIEISDDGSELFIPMAKYSASLQEVISVFRKSSGQWSQQQDLAPPSGNTFVGKIDLKGSQMLSGAVSSTGKAAVLFSKNDSSGVWEQVENLTLPVTHEGDIKSAAILSPTFIALGMPYDSSDAGTVGAWKKNGGTWSYQSSALTQPSSTASQRFGYSISSSLDGKSVFIGGTGSGSNGAGTLSIQSPQTTTYSVSVSKNNNAAGVVTSSSEGISCGAACQNLFPSGDNVTLSAIPSSGYAFDSWTGDCSDEQSSQCTLSNLSSDKSTQANFIKMHSVSLSLTGAGFGSFSANGQACTQPCSLSVKDGSSVQLSISLGNQSFVEQWSGATCQEGQTSNICSFVVSGDKSIALSLGQFYNVSLSKNTPLGGDINSLDGNLSCGNDCSHLYRDGSSFTLQAVPKPGYRFVGWSGDCSGAQNTCTVSNLASGKNISAQFEAISYTVSVSQPQGGTVVSLDGDLNCGSDCSHQYTEGSSITLEARPQQGYKFVSWGGSCSGAQVTCIISNINSAKSVTATFASAYTLKINKEGSGAVSVSTVSPNVETMRCQEATCSFFIDAGSQIQIRAEPSGGNFFGGWGDRCQGSAGLSCSFRMDADVTLNLSFLNSNQYCKVPSVADKEVNEALRRIESAGCKVGKLHGRTKTDLLTDHRVDKTSIEPGEYTLKSNPVDVWIRTIWQKNEYIRFYTDERRQCVVTSCAVPALVDWDAYIKVRHCSGINGLMANFQAIRPNLSSRKTVDSYYHQRNLVKGPQSPGAYRSAVFKCKAGEFRFSIFDFSSLRDGGISEGYAWVRPIFTKKRKKKLSLPRGTAQVSKIFPGAISKFNTDPLFFGGSSIYK